MKYIKRILENYNNTDIGLVFMRIIFGTFMFINHGYSKLLGGINRWERLGSALTDFIGLSFLQTFFGLMAALSESVFSLFIVLGLLTRISSTLLFITMFIASAHHLVDNEVPEMAILYASFCLLLLIAGPGKYSLDNHFLKNNNN
tara:strand:- start:486 stop:920 length:435 start_codon:yes stop_codon:yes gene_type:complete